MAVDDRDSVTGYLTTGHEWNGIKELNTPVPRAVYFFLIATALFSLGYWILMPEWPLWSTFTKGLLGADQRLSVAESLKEATLDRAAWTTRVEQADAATVQGDAKLMELVRQTGRTLFGDNCAACHGREGRGGPGFPSLVTSSFLWGGTPEAIAETIRVGINSPHPKTRTSQMLAFGRDGILQRDALENVVAYVQSLSNPAMAGASAEQIAAGKAVFAANCASCHGDTGAGKIDVGAPNLTDRFWIYGGDWQSIYTSVWG